MTTSENAPRVLSVHAIRHEVRRQYIEANVSLRQDHLDALRRAVETERSALGRDVLCRLIANNDASTEARMPFCQDTGYAVLFIELGQDVRLVDGDLNEAIHEGVREAHREAHLRASIVHDPLRRENTGDNTPALINLEIVPGTGCRITVLVKGAGCDNMSALTMLTPAHGTDDIVDFVVGTVERAGPSASPPVTVGVGLGGTFDRAAVLAKRALTRTSGAANPDPEIAALEGRILQGINDLGIGPAGFGGTTTAVAVHVEVHATHIAAMPVAVNLDCHSHRVREVVL